MATISKTLSNLWPKGLTSTQLLFHTQTSQQPSEAAQATRPARQGQVAPNLPAGSGSPSSPLSTAMSQAQALVAHANALTGGDPPAPGGDLQAHPRQRREGESWFRHTLRQLTRHADEKRVGGIQAAYLPTARPLAQEGAARPPAQTIENLTVRLEGFKNTLAAIDRELAEPHGSQAGARLQHAKVQVQKDLAQAQSQLDQLKSLQLRQGLHTELAAKEGELAHEQEQFAAHRQTAELLSAQGQMSLQRPAGALPEDLRKTLEAALETLQKDLPAAQRAVEAAEQSVAPESVARMNTVRKGFALRAHDQSQHRLASLNAAIAKLQERLNPGGVDNAAQRNAVLVPSDKFREAMTLAMASAERIDALAADIKALHASMAEEAQRPISELTVHPPIEAGLVQLVKTNSKHAAGEFQLEALGRLESQLKAVDDELKQADATPEDLLARVQHSLAKLATAKEGAALALGAANDRRLGAQKDVTAARESLRDDWLAQPEQLGFAAEHTPVSRAVLRSAAIEVLDTPMLLDAGDVVLRCLAKATKGELGPCAPHEAVDALEQLKTLTAADLLSHADQLAQPGTSTGEGAQAPERAKQQALATACNLAALPGGVDLVHELCPQVTEDEASAIGVFFTAKNELARLREAVAAAPAGSPVPERSLAWLDMAMQGARHTVVPQDEALRNLADPEVQDMERAAFNGVRNGYVTAEPGSQLDVVNQKLSSMLAELTQHQDELFALAQKSLANVGFEAPAAAVAEASGAANPENPPFMALSQAHDLSPGSHTVLNKTVIHGLSSGGLGEAPVAAVPAVTAGVNLRATRALTTQLTIDGGLDETAMSLRRQTRKDGRLTGRLSVGIPQFLPVVKMSGTAQGSVQKLHEKVDEIRIRVPRRAGQLPGADSAEQQMRDVLSTVLQAAPHQSDQAPHTTIVGKLLAQHPAIVIAPFESTLSGMNVGAGVRVSASAGFSFAGLNLGKVVAGVSGSVGGGFDANRLQARSRGSETGGAERIDGVANRVATAVTASAAVAGGAGLAPVGAGGLGLPVVAIGGNVHVGGKSVAIDVAAKDGAFIGAERNLSFANFGAYKQALTADRDRYLARAQVRVKNTAADSADTTPSPVDLGKQLDAHLAQAATLAGGFKNNGRIRFVVREQLHEDVRVHLRAASIRVQQAMQDKRDDDVRKIEQTASALLADPESWRVLETGVDADAVSGKGTSFELLYVQQRSRTATSSRRLMEFPLLSEGGTREADEPPPPGASGSTASSVSGPSPSRAAIDPVGEITSASSALPSSRVTPARDSPPLPDPPRSAVQAARVPGRAPAATGRGPAPLSGTRVVGRSADAPSVARGSELHAKLAAAKASLGVVAAAVKRAERALPARSGPGEDLPNDGGVLRSDLQSLQQQRARKAKLEADVARFELAIASRSAGERDPEIRSKASS